MRLTRVQGAKRRVRQQVGCGALGSGRLAIAGMYSGGVVAQDSMVVRRGGGVSQRL